MNVIIFLTGFLSGVALRSVIHIPQLAVSGLFSASFISAIYVHVLYRRGMLDAKVLYIILYLFALGTGIMRFAIAENEFQKEKAFSEKEFVGIVDEIPVIGDHAVSARTKVGKGYVLLRVQKENILAYGDRVSVKATCEVPKDFETNTGTIFDYDRYLMARDMHHVCKAHSIAVLESGAGNALRDALYSLRQWFSHHIDQAFRNPHAGLIRGVLLGDKSGLTTDLKSEMTIAGVIHIAVLSGSNIALVAAIIFGITKSLPYNIRIFISVLVVISFVVLSGAEPPAVRAGILVAIMFLGKFLHRSLHTGRALLLIAFLMVAWNPFALVYDMSFQLSFLATIGIIYIAPIMEMFLGRITEKFGLRDIISGTLGAQIAVTPLLLYATGSFSVVSLPANVLIGWAVPLLMSAGFFGGMLHAISVFVAMPVIFLSETISGYIISITKISAHLPFAQILLPLNHPLVLCAMYLSLIFILKRLQSVPQKASS